MHTTMRKVSLLLMVVFVVLATVSICGAVTIDDFSYSSPVGAAQAWVPKFGSEQPQLANIDGVKLPSFSLRLHEGCPA